AQFLAQAIADLPLAAAAEQFFERGLAAELGQIAKANDAIIGEAGEQAWDVPGHEQRLDMRDERPRFLDVLRITLSHSLSLQKNTSPQRTRRFTTDAMAAEPLRRHRVPPR